MSEPQGFFPEPEHFTNQLEMLGPGTVAVSIGGISVRFEGLKPELEFLTREKYAPFLWRGPVSHTVSLHSGEATYLAPEHYLPLHERSYREGDVLASVDFASFRTPDRQQGVLRVCFPDNTGKVSGAMENHLRWMVADLALDRSGFVLHSAAVVVGGEAYVFFGHSGAGKSTVASLSDGALLSDDLVLLQKIRDSWSAATTPFAGTFPQAFKTAGNYPIAGLYLLKKSTTVEVRLLPGGLAAGALLTCSPFVSNATREHRLMPLIEDLVSKIPVNELYFRKDASFWDELAPQARSKVR